MARKKSDLETKSNMRKPQIEVNLDAGTRESENSKSSSAFFRSIFLFTFVWWAGIIFIYLQGETTKTNDACLASQRIITVLEMVPYKLHSPDLLSAIPTIQKVYNVQMTLWDQAPGTFVPQGVVRFTPPGTTSQSAADVYNGMREYNLFTMTMPYANTITGSTNWMEYKIVFNNLADISLSCLAPFSTFNFINPSGNIQFDVSST